MENTHSPTSFQFTPLREGRRIDANGFRHQLHFNSRPSARGDEMLNMSITGRLYFNSRPSARGDLYYASDIIHELISIHAPPRGATSDDGHHQPACSNFNSRPSARGDVLTDGNRGNPNVFQFTPLREGRHLYYPPFGVIQLISIHAPPRGATAKDMQFLQIFCSTLTNQHGLTIVPRNLSRLFW